MLGRVFRRAVVAGTAVVGLEAAYAVLRPSPELEQFDPSGDYGMETNPELRFAVLGDSSITAPGVANVDEIWVTRVAHRLAESRRVVLRSFAVGGSMATDLLEDQMEEAILFGPDLVLVSVGANDVIKGVPIRQFATAMDELIAELSDTGAVVIQSGVGDLGTIPRLYPPLSNLMSRRSQKFDRVHWDIGWKYGTTVLPQRGDDRDVWFNDRTLWSADLFHVSAAGHERWANTTWRILEPMLDEI